VLNDQIQIASEISISTALTSSENVA
jgi:hypothetical protein